MKKASNTPLVSIITICYNSDKHLEQTILSVINQTYRNIEYIIIDGGSTDKTLEIVKKYETHLSFWVSEKDRGISDAFNKGIEKATGEIIGLINSDDWYQPNTVENVISEFGKGDIFYGDLQYWNNEKKEYVFTSNHLLLPKEMTVSHPTIFVKKKIYELHGMFKETYKYAMDYELLLRFYVNNCSFHYIPIILANFRMDGASDINWKKAILEIKNAKIENGLNKNVYHYFYYQILRSHLSRLLKKSFLSFILVNYRKYFSTIKKIKN